MIVNISDVWADARHQHLRYQTTLLNGVIQDLALSPNPIEKRIATFLAENLVGLTTVHSADLPTVIHRFNTMFVPVADRAYAIDLLKEYIDYAGFSKKEDWETREWSAYKLCALARYDVCPYCHASSIQTMLPDPVSKKGFRPDLDHFYAKGHYPYLALTLGNLIPSCEKCNGPQCKHDIDFGLHPHLNPLCDSESISFSLEVSPAYTHTLFGTLSLDDKPDHYVIRLLPIPGADINKTSASLQTFGLNDRYKLMRNEMYFLRRRLRYVKQRQQIITDAIPGLHLHVEDVVGFDPTTSAYKNALYGKLKRDLYDTTEAEILGIAP